MGKGIVPPKSELFSKTYDGSFWRNFFDNPTTVQFDHRVLVSLYNDFIIIVYLIYN